MLLSVLLREVNVLNDFTDCEVDAVTCSTNSVLDSAAFVCIDGEKFNGNDYAKLALQHGAAVIISAVRHPLEKLVLVEDARAAYALMCKAFHKNCADKMSLVATTGTNGKTSVTTIIGSILNHANMKAGIITTVGASCDGYSCELDNTTPEPGALHNIFDTMHTANCTHVCMEASSHALCQQRLCGLRFDVAIFTNLSLDHLNFHSDMEDYYSAKKRLFNMADFAVINIDDTYGLRLAGEISIPFATFSTTNHEATFLADNILYNSDGVSFTIHHQDIKSKIDFTMPGIHSIENALASIAATMRLGVSISTISDCLRQFAGIKGRSEIIKTGANFSVICDYAHTPDGLLGILKSTRAYSSGRVIVVFGCGGDRDKGKRAKMGEIASKYADFTVVTSDNPRTENALKIMEEIVAGMDKTAQFIPIQSRTQAIQYAVSIARRGDVIILAGKGHEMYQIIGEKKVYYDERKIVQGAIKRLHP